MCAGSVGLPTIVSAPRSWHPALGCPPVIDVSTRYHILSLPRLLFIWLQSRCRHKDRYTICLHLIDYYVTLSICSHNDVWLFLHLAVHQCSLCISLTGASGSPVNVIMMHCGLRCPSATCHYVTTSQSFAAEQSTLGQETGPSRDHKGQEDDHVLLDTIYAFLNMANVSNNNNTVLTFVFFTMRHILLICWALYLQTEVCVYLTI